MKKIIALLLSLFFIMNTVSIAGAAAEEQSTEEKAYKIFLSLADIYDGAMNALNQLELTWSTTSTAKINEADSFWFYKNIMMSGDIDRWSHIIRFFEENTDCTAEDVRDRDIIYEKCFVPLLWRAGQTDKGLRIACTTFTSMVFINDSWNDQLAAQKNAIKELMSDAPDYAYLADLQNLYKKTSQLLDYLHDDADSLFNTLQRISDFRQTRRELKSDFEFIFDWPDYHYSVPVMPAAYQQIYVQYAEKKKQDEELEKVAYKKTLLPEISLDMTYDEIWNALSKNSGYKLKKYKNEIDVKDVSVASYRFESICFLFGDSTNPQKLTSIQYEANGTSSKASANSAYSQVYASFASILGNPSANNSKQARPTYNKLDGNLAWLVSGPAYKKADFEGKILSFSEWLVDDGNEFLSIIVYNKHYPAHMYYDVQVQYDFVPYSSVK